MKTRSGSIYRSPKKTGPWYAKVSWIDPAVLDPKTGKAKRRWRKHKATSKAHASSLRDEMLREMEAGITDEQRRIVTFRDIAELYCEQIAVPQLAS